MNKRVTVSIIGTRAKEALSRKNETQKTFCDKYEYDPPYFSKCLKKGRMPDYMFNDLVKFLDCSPEWLSKESSNDEGKTLIQHERSEAEKNQRDIIKQFFKLAEIRSEFIDELNENEIIDLVYQCSLVAHAIIRDRKKHIQELKTKIKDEKSFFEEMRQEGIRNMQEIEKLNDIREEKLNNVAAGQPTPRKRGKNE